MKDWEKLIFSGGAIIGCYEAVAKILPDSDVATNYQNEIKQLGDTVWFLDGFTMCCDRSIYRSIPRKADMNFLLSAAGRKLGMVMGRYIAMKHGPSVTRFAAQAFVVGRQIRIVYGISNL